MKKKIICIVVSAMLITGVTCSSVFAGNSKNAKFHAAVSTSTCDKNCENPNEKMLIGKVTAVSDDSLTIEIMSGNHMKHNSGKTNNTNSSSDKFQTEEKTVNLTDSTEYYKVSDGAKTEISLSDISEDSMVSINCDDTSSDDLTADTVMIMDNKNVNANGLMGKVISVSDDSLNIAAVSGNHMFKNNANKSDDTSSSSDESQAVERTVNLTDSTEYYKVSDGAKTEISLSDITEDSIVNIKYDKDDSGDLTADTVMIMDNKNAYVHGLVGKVTSVSDDSLTIETMNGNHMKHNANKTDDTSSDESQTVEKTVNLTDSTKYYKVSDGTKTEISLSDITEDSMVSIKCDDTSSDDLTADTVTIMDKTIMSTTNSSDDE
ncbi:MAG: hypothetical protein LKJ13_07890 [Clostridia bacterium]|jgi:preprotein translocase subunit YajC|nr:hypothetical protein [Clostridia bacterium]MCI2000754.1 hypothetical protein [Clostridia bacterium]MCI2015454.1 hypothetical protein [Clostridia bacterium]